MYQIVFIIRVVLILPFLPILLVQGMRLRRRLPEPIAATGNSFGTCIGTGKKMNLLLIGESTVEGVGVKYYEQTIGAKIAAALSMALQRTIDWQAIGKIGAKMAFVRRELVPLIDTTIPYEAVVILMGANDSLQLTPPAAWQQEFIGLIKDLQKIQPQALLYIGTLPPVGQFYIIPQPARFFLGLHNRLLVRATQNLASTQQGVFFSQFIFEKLTPDFFSKDGVHPSEKGYADWASKITTELVLFLSP